MNRPKNIIIIAPAWVGDLVMTQTLFKFLKSKDPEIKLTVLSPAWGEALLARMPQVDHIITASFNHGKLNLIRRYLLARRLRAYKFDQAIILPNSFKSALIPCWAKIPRRTGWRGEMRWALLNDLRYLDKGRYPLMIQRFLALGLELGEELPTHLPLPELMIPKESIQATFKKLQLSKSKKPILALCPGAAYGVSKRWLPEYFAEVAKVKIKQGWQVWLFGGKEDKTIAAEIQKLSNNNCVDLTGETNLAEAIDLLSLATKVVTNDSGLMHVAAALNCSLVVIYGSSSPHFTPPLCHDVKILSLQLMCSPCFKRRCPLKHFKCMKDLLPERVLQALDNGHL